MVVVESWCSSTSCRAADRNSSERNHGARLHHLLPPPAGLQQRRCGAASPRLHDEGATAWRRERVGQ